MGGEGERKEATLYKEAVLRGAAEAYGVRARFSVLFRLVSCACRIKMKSSTFDLGPLTVQKVLCVYVQPLESGKRRRRETENERLLGGLFSSSLPPSLCLSGSD